MPWQPKFPGASLLLATVCLGFIGGVAFQRQYGAGTLLGVARGLFLRTEAAEPARPTLGIPEGWRGGVSLFVLAGQSNMSGMAPIPANQAPHPRVFVFGNDYRWKPALEPVDDPSGQVDEVSADAGAGFGPGLSFALALVNERPDMVIGLVPCAKSDTTIAEWRRSLSDSTLYGSCLKRIRAASLEGDVAGVLFYQGEADAFDPVRFPERPLAATAYARSFSAVVQDLRSDLRSPRLPVVFAQIAAQPSPVVFSQWGVIREQQRQVRMPCAAMITTDDLPLQDGLHFTTDGYRVIGERFAAQYLRVASQCPTA